MTPYQYLSVCIFKCWLGNRKQDEDVTKECHSSGWQSAIFCSDIAPLHVDSFMLTLIEDAIRENGKVSPENMEPTSALCGERDSLMTLSKTTLCKRTLPGPIICLTDFSQWILQELGSEWQNANPSTSETTLYPSNPMFISQFISRLGDKSGKPLERLAQYLSLCKLLD